jgi:hypothetical protein
MCRRHSYDDRNRTDRGMSLPTRLHRVEGARPAHGADALAARMQRVLVLHRHDSGVAGRCIATLWITRGARERRAFGDTRSPRSARCRNYVNRARCRVRCLNGLASLADLSFRLAGPEGLAPGHGPS